MKKKRLLFILDHAYGGGAENITVNLAEALSYEYHVGLLILDRTNLNVNIPKSITQLTVKDNHKFIQSNFWRLKNFSTEYKNEIQNSIDSFHADLLIIGFWNSLHLASFLKHSQVFYWIHGNIFFQPKAKSFKYIIRNFFRKIRQPYFFKNLMNGQNIIVVNNDLNKRIKKICPNSKVVTLYNGIQPRKIDQQKNIIWDAIYVGRLSSEKQVDHAIKAFSQSKLTGKMAIVGDGYLKEQIIRLIEELNLKDRVILLGWLAPDQVAQHIHSSKLLILSSQTEGYGLVISEALMVNTPVVAYNCGDGVQYQLQNKLSRGLAEPQNISSLTMAINRVANTNIYITDGDKNKLCLDTMKDRFEELTGI